MALEAERCCPDVVLKDWSLRWLVNPLLTKDFRYGITFNPQPIWEMKQLRFRETKCIQGHRSSEWYNPNSSPCFSVSSIHRNDNIKRYYSINQLHTRDSVTGLMLPFLSSQNNSDAGILSSQHGWQSSKGLNNIPKVVDCSPGIGSQPVSPLTMADDRKWGEKRRGLRC